VKFDCLIYNINRSDKISLKFKYLHKCINSK